MSCVLGKHKWDGWSLSYHRSDLTDIVIAFLRVSEEVNGFCLQHYIEEKVPISLEKSICKLSAFLLYMKN